MIATLRAAETIPIASNSIKYLHRGYGESISEYLCKMQGWRKVVRRTPRLSVFVPPTLRRLFFLPSLHFDPLYSSRSWNVNFHETSRAYERYVSRYTDSSLRTNVKTTSLSTLCLYRPVVTPPFAISRSFSSGTRVSFFSSFSLCWLSTVGKKEWQEWLALLLLEIIHFLHFIQWWKVFFSNIQNCEWKERL